MYQHNFFSSANIICCDLCLIEVVLIINLGRSDTAPITRSHVSSCKKMMKKCIPIITLGV